MRALRSRSVRLAGRLWPALLVFSLSRAATLFVAFAVRLVEPDTGGAVRVLGARWDSGWYASIVEDGYPTEVPEGTTTSLAFFPLYPLIVRAVTAVTSIDVTVGLVVVSLLCGLVAAGALWLLIAEVADDDTATRGVALFSFFPGAFVLSMGYSEALFVALAAICLLGLVRRWWVVAGVAAALAGVTRPTGLVLGACCAWAAFVAVRERREWRAVAAPLLAPVGLLAHVVFLSRHTGSATVWFRAQREGWEHRVDFGATTLGRIPDFLGDPLGDFNLLVNLGCIALIAVGAVLLWRWRPPAVLTIFTIGTLVPALSSELLASVPRYTLSAFPLVVALARPLRGAVFAAVLGVSAVLMATFLFVSGISLLLTP